jgi:hypothetical protein
MTLFLFALSVLVGSKVGQIVVRCLRSYGVQL